MYIFSEEPRENPFDTLFCGEFARMLITGETEPTRAQ